MVYKFLGVNDSVVKLGVVMYLKIIVFLGLFGFYDISCRQESDSTSHEFKVDGVVNGGGGKGVLCDNNVQTLDLYEAKNQGWPEPVSSGFLEPDLKKYGMEMWKHMVMVNEQMTEDTMFLILNNAVIEKFQDIPKGNRLPLTEDATIPQLEPQCAIVQIAIYTNEGKIYRDKEYWEKLSPVDQAALIVHEWVYKYSRDGGSLDSIGARSDESRKVVGLIFSGNNPEPKFPPIWQAPKRILCGAGRRDTDQEIFEFYGIDESKNDQQGIGFYFHGFKGIYPVSRTSTYLPNTNLEELMTKGIKSPRSLTVVNNVLDKQWSLELQPSSEDDVPTMTEYYPRFNIRATELSNDPEIPFSYGSCSWWTEEDDSPNVE